MATENAVAEVKHAEAKHAEAKLAEKSADKVPEKRRALGRGLDALLPSRPRPIAVPPAASSADAKGQQGTASPRSAGSGAGSTVGADLSSAAAEQATPGAGGAGIAAVTSAHPTSGAVSVVPGRSVSNNSEVGTTPIESVPIADTAQHQTSGVTEEALASAAGAPQPGTIGDLQAQAASRPEQQVLQIPVDHIDRNPYQTRMVSLDDEFERGATTLAELADSIRANGVIQPITVRPAKDGRYVLITGERRWRASKLAGREKIPAIVRTVSDQQAAEMTIVENLQRQDLNCLEQAHAFARLSKDFALTQEQIGKRVGVSRETVSNYMRLLRLPALVQHHLQTYKLGFSEARVLLSLEDPDVITRVANQAVNKNLSVEQLEDVVIKETCTPQEGQGPRRGARWVDPNVRAAQRDLERILGLRVRIRDRKGKGKITIDYATVDDYERVVEALRRK